MAAMAATMWACSSEETEILPADYTEIGTDVAGNGGDYAGFYLLNEGNMGANKCTLDYFDYSTGQYIRNIYSERNPNAVLELGDVGNDIAINGDRLYVVVAGSHKVEVLDAKTAVRIGQVNIDSPREIAFAGGKGYVTSYVGGANDRGTLVRFDLGTLAVDGTAEVGYNPECVLLHEGKLFVANSFNYGIGAYDNTVSVVDPATMAIDYTIATDAVNLQDIVADQYGQLWINTLGNYNDIYDKLICLRKQPDGRYAEQGMDLLGNYGGMAFYKDCIYYFETYYDYEWNAYYRYGGIIGSTDGTKIPVRILDLQDESAIQTPYAMAVNNSTGDLFITDAKNYTSSGKLFCYTLSGKLKWSVTTGDIPGHIAFLPK